MKIYRSQHIKKNENHIIRNIFLITTNSLVYLRFYIAYFYLKINIEMTKNKIQFNKKTSLSKLVFIIPKTLPLKTIIFFSVLTAV